MFALHPELLPWYLGLVALLIFCAFVVCAISEFIGYERAKFAFLAAERQPVDDGPLDPPYSFASDTLDAVRDRIR